MNPRSTARNAFRSSWLVRRRIIIIVLVWCGAMVTYLAILGRPIQLSETAVNGLLLLMASVIGSYVFGAVWDDKGGLNNIGGGGAMQETYQRTVVPPEVPTGPAMPPPPGEGP
ncbi:hypothetical protein EFV37_29115 [Mesorhizobium loti]|uniref:Uncharacterized protein n=1 Tax=Mesorhizobium jarvisii TaxID=1777867 RepID=A0A6M7TLF9_9HYPH|nr:MULTISPECIES: hypothetical protein [Mesorhizobium]OBQ68899.1 hypothetical protein A9K72_11965 [Mesorhizobium loti]QKC65864.1 hypothetical protein EB229_29105 [Mesorhizobium jarvisii]QKD11778.1 hypothetical protein EFV37_29115 [Mesorhizobium loti]RJT37884.1 hypothetical protein D3242_01160 [Mesorhizobium jarvisii]